MERYDDQPVSSVPAVAVLVAGARDSALDKDYEKAADRLERALRIEPANPRIWHELALVYFARGDFQQAIQFARKSNTLTADSGLISRNTRLIAQAGERQKTSD